MTFMATVGGHDPEEIPGASLRINVFNVGSSVSGPSSRIEPSSAPNMPVVF